MVKKRKMMTILQEVINKYIYKLKTTKSTLFLRKFFYTRRNKRF